MKKWRQRAEEKSKLAEQTEEIRQKFKMDKIKKEFGQLSGEELFRPITKRLDEKNTTVEEEEEQEFPDYTMDEFDETYPFGDEFRPDAPTPSSSPPPPPYDDDDDDDDDFPLPPPPLMEETPKRKEWAKPGPVELEYPNESILLQNINQIITIKGHDENYTVGESKLGLKCKTIAELKKMRDEINKRRGTHPLSKRLQEGKKRLKSTSLQEKRERPLTPLEKTVMSRRPAFELSDDEDDSYEQDWEIEGSGFYDDEAEKLINQLNLSFASIKAGNNSRKL